MEYLKGSHDAKELAQKVRKYEEIVDKMQMEVMIFMGKVMSSPLTADESRAVKSILRMADEYESITDYCYSIVNYTKRIYQEGFQLDPKTRQEIHELADKAQELYGSINNRVIENSSFDSVEFKPLWDEFNETADRMKETHLQRVAEKQFPALASLTLSDIVVSLRRIKNHTVNLAEAYQGGK